MHARMLKKAGETDQRLFTVAAWRDAPYFTDVERAALCALTEGGDTTERPRGSRS
jgi:alkylhydroperoxidase family enzyme